MKVLQILELHHKNLYEVVYVKPFQRLLNKY